MASSTARLSTGERSRVTEVELLHPDASFENTIEVLYEFAEIYTILGVVVDDKLLPVKLVLGIDDVYGQRMRGLQNLAAYLGHRGLVCGFHDELSTLLWMSHPQDAFEHVLVVARKREFDNRI